MPAAQSGPATWLIYDKHYSGWRYARLPEVTSHERFQEGRGATLAPLVAKNMVVAGVACAEFGVRARLPVSAA